MYGNPIGIRGTYSIGPADWGSELHNLIHNNGTGVWRLPGAEVRFNRIYANATGVQVERRRAGAPQPDLPQHGRRRARGRRHDVEVVNNTIYARRRATAATGRLRRRRRRAQQHRLHCLGLRPDVAADSQFGYTSDYNNSLHGRRRQVAFQGKGFFDLYDWQVEAESDLHSIGYTTVDPTLDDPAVRQSWRLTITDSRAASTSIDAGRSRRATSEPAPNGNRINLGAYGNTPAGESAPRWMRLTVPANFYVDLIPRGPIRSPGRPTTSPDPVQPGH